MTFRLCDVVDDEFHRSCPALLSFVDKHVTQAIDSISILKISKLVRLGLEQTLHEDKDAP